MYELQVDGMTCNHCVSHVTKSLKALDAGAKVEVDLAGKTVRVDTQASLDDIREALDDAGYPVVGSKAG